MPITPEQLPEGRSGTPEGQQPPPQQLPPQPQQQTIPVLPNGQPGVVPLQPMTTPNMVSMLPQGADPQRFAIAGQLRQRVALVQGMRTQLTQGQPQTPTVTDNAPFRSLFGESTDVKTLSTKPREEQVETLASAAYDRVEDGFTKPIVEQMDGIEKEDQMRTLFALLSNPDAVDFDGIRDFLPEKMRKKKDGRFGAIIEGEQTTGFSIGAMDERKELSAAGRTLVASSVGNALGIEHEIASAHNHSFVLFKYPNGKFTYFDPHQGMLCEVPMAALQVEPNANLREGLVASMNIDAVETPVHQGIGPIHQSFVLHNAKDGVVFQVLRNMSGHNPDEDKEAIDQVDALRNELFPTLPTAPEYTTEGIMGAVDMPTARMEQQLILFRELVEHNWQITDNVLLIVKQYRLFGIPGDTKEKQKLSLLMSVLSLERWRSSGPSDVMGRLLSEVTGHANTEGTSIADFIENEDRNNLSRTQQERKRALEEAETEDDDDDDEDEEESTEPQAA